MIAAILICLAGWAFFASLGWITHHGKYLEVPDVISMNVDKAVSQLHKNGFEAVIVDSAYNDSLPLNVIKRQLPYAGATVKVNRKIFLNVNPKTLPMVPMPELEGLTKDFAITNLKRNNLNIGAITERPDFMKGSVLEQKYNGKKIKAGDKVRWGSKIDLVVGAGVQETSIPVPDLYGMTVNEARDLLQSQGLIVASIITSEGGIDTANAFIYKQNPEAFDYSGDRKQIHPGQAMDIWIQTDIPESRDSTKVEPGIPMPRSNQSDY